MKDNFENNIKKSLENLKFEYNPRAWEDLSSRLDTVKPVNNIGLKLWIAAGVVGVVITSWFLMQLNSLEIEKKLPSNTTVAIDSSDKIKDNSSDTNNVSSNTERIKVEKKYEPEALKDSPNINSENQSDINSLTDKEQVSKNNLSVNIEDSNINSSNPIQTNEIEKNELESIQDVKYYAPALAESYCQDQKISLNNKNTFEIIIVFPNGDEKLFSPNNKKDLSLTASGRYKIGFYKNLEFIEKDNFFVFEKPDASFSFIRQDEVYNEGLPVTYLSANTLAENYTWTFDDAFKASGKNVNANFYTKGSHSIKLVVSDNNGCIASSNESFRKEDNYNLQAPLSFVPTDNDFRNNRFMPFSLFERTDVNFEMIVIDPQDGHVVFTSKSVDNSWDGIDRQTGNLVDYARPFIWTVKILNPKQGENSEYRGSVTPLSDRR